MLFRNLAHTKKFVISLLLKFNNPRNLFYWRRILLTFMCFRLYSICLLAVASSLPPLLTLKYGLLIQHIMNSFIPFQLLSNNGCILTVTVLVNYEIIKWCTYTPVLCRTWCNWPRGVVLVCFIIVCCRLVDMTVERRFSRRKGVFIRCLVFAICNFHQTVCNNVFLGRSRNKGLLFYRSNMQWKPSLTLALVWEF